MSEMSSNARMLSLMRLLADPLKQFDVRTLADHFQTSERTIRRDLKDLKQQGIEIHELTGQNNHKTYSINRSSLPPIRLTFDEALAVFLGKAQLNAFHGSGVEDAAVSAYEKLRLWLGESEAKYVGKISERIHFSRLHGFRVDQSNVIDSLMVAVEDNRAIFIEYQSARSTEPLTYDIYPYGLAEHRDSLYVVGHSCHHDEVRTWKIDRIRSAELTLFPFKRPANFVISQFFDGAFSIVTGKEKRSVRVRFTGTAIPYVTEKQFHISQQTHQQADGSVIIEFQLDSLMEVKSWILSFGVKAEVLDPSELRAEIAQELRQMSEYYRLEKHIQDPLSNPFPTPRPQKETDR